MQIHMKSDRGEIEVFLCPEEEALNMGGLTSEDSAAEDTDSEATINSPLKIKKENGVIESSQFSDSGTLLSQTTGRTPQPSTSQMGGSPPGPTQTWEAPSRSGHPGDIDNGLPGSDNQAMKNALIWESEDFGPIGNRFQQQTVDQDHHHGKQDFGFFALLLAFFLMFFQTYLTTPFKMGFKMRPVVTRSSRRYCRSVMHVKKLYVTKLVYHSSSTVGLRVRIHTQYRTGLKSFIDGANDYYKKRT